MTRLSEPVSRCFLHILLWTLNLVSLLGLFDYPAVLFALEVLIFFGGLFAYTQYAPLSARAGYKRNPNWIKAVIGVFLAQQAQFCFSSYVSRSMAQHWARGLTMG